MALLEGLLPSRWFEGFSWEFLKKGTLGAPFVPKVRRLALFTLKILDAFRSSMMLIRRISISSLKTMLPSPKMIWPVGIKNSNPTGLCRTLDIGRFSSERISSQGLFIEQISSLSFFVLAFDFLFFMLYRKLLQVCLFFLLLCVCFC